MEIKMIGLDLDGTALNDSGEFSKRTRQAFKRAHENGIHVVIATGRAEFSLPKNIAEIEGLEYVITSNGARVIRLSDGSVVYKNFIKPTKVREVIEVLKSQNARAEMFANGKAYISRSEYDAIVSGDIMTRSRGYVIATRNPIDDIFTHMIDWEDHIENISVNYPNDEAKRACEKKLAEIEGITVTSSFPLNNEIGGATTSKADALEFLLKNFGLHKDNLMVCGDSRNDIAMIEYAGLGIAMENADDCVKDAADITTLSNEEDGVAYAIEKYALKSI
jgi:cof-like hydrolase